MYNSIQFMEKYTCFQHLINCYSQITFH